MKLNLYPIFLTVLFGSCISVKAQNDSYQQNIIPNDIFRDDSSVNLFVVGESHMDENLDVNLTLLFELNKTHGVNKLGIESALGLQEFYNRFLNTGDETIFELLEEDDRIHKKDTRKMLTAIRNYNLNYSSDNPIQIFCFDHATNSNYSQLLVLRYLFQDVENINKLKLGEYIKVENYTNDLYELIGIVKELDKDLVEHDSLYVTILQEKYMVYTKIIRGMKIRYVPIFSYKYDQFLTRENYIINNLIDELGSEDHAMIICGYAHGSIKENDTLFFPEGFNSFTHALKNKTSLSILSICEHYYLTTMADIFFNSMNLLNTPIKEITDKNEKCTFIRDANLLIHTEAAERYDMIIIHNQRLKYKI